MNEQFEGLKPRIAVDIIRERFPKFDKSLYSKVTHPDRYGVVLHPEAAEMLRAALYDPDTPPTKRHKSGRHLLTREIRCRLPDADADALKLAIVNAGYATVQDWMSSIVKDFLAKGDDDVTV